MEPTNKPIIEVKYGNIKATAWLNHGEKGEFFSIDVSRLYKDQSDQWQRSSSFGLADLPIVEKVAADAFRAIHQHRTNAGEGVESA